MLKTTDTYTYVNLPVSPSTFDEIYRLLQQAGYTHAIEGTGGAIDMHGIALIRQEDELTSIKSKIEKIRSLIDGYQKTSTRVLEDRIRKILDSGYL